MNDRYTVYFLSKTRKKMHLFIKTLLKEHKIDDIDPSYGNIFTMLYEHDGKLSMKEIAQLTGKDKSTITSHVKQLIKAGYLNKEQSEEDKRITYIGLTKKGWDFKPIYHDISTKLYEQTYKGFTNEEKDQFLNLLKKMNTNFNKNPQD